MPQNTGETEMRDISPQEYTYQKKFPLDGWDWAAKLTEHTQFIFYETLCVDTLHSFL